MDISITGKAENAGYHFLLLTQCFQKPPSSGSLEMIVLVVSDGHIFPGFLTPVLTQLSF